MPVTIEQQLVGKTGEEQALIKAQALAAAAPGNKRLTYTQNGVTYTVRGWYVDAGGAFCVTVTATDANGKVPTDDLYRFYNPPVMAGGIEDPLGAAKQIVVGAVEAYARKQGWTP